VNSADNLNEPGSRFSLDGLPDENTTQPALGLQPAEPLSREPSYAVPGLRTYRNGEAILMVFQQSSQSHQDTVEICSPQWLNHPQGVFLKGWVSLFSSKVS